MIRFLSKAILVFAALMLPVALLGWLLAGLPGLLVFIGLGYVYLLFLAFACEGKVQQALKAAPITEQSIAHGLDRMMSQVVQRLIAERRLADPRFRPDELFIPEVYIFPDPYPSGYVTRAVSGSGSILLSQGLLLSVGEAELRAILTGALLRNQERDWPFKTYCMLLVMLLSRLAPASWNRLVFASRDAATQVETFTTVGALRFWMILPLVRALMDLANPKALSAQELRGAGESWETYCDAMRKVEAATRFGGWSWTPAPTAVSCMGTLDCAK